MSDTARVQYVYLDVVGFTKDRSVEAQSAVVDTLNGIVGKVLEDLVVPKERTVLLPTGDGMVIALVEVSGVDLHLQVSLHILRLVAEHNGTVSEQSRCFEVRIGVNENVDNVLRDINGKRNVAGAGISMARRIMDVADGGQVLVGTGVYEVLRQREQYMSSFRAFRFRGKHGAEFDVFQCVSKEHPWLNVDVPKAFDREERRVLRFDELTAHYVAHAVTNRQFLLSRGGDPVRDYVGPILLWMLARDSLAAAQAAEYEVPTTRTWQAGSASFEAQYRHYADLEFWVLAGFGDLIERVYLFPYFEHFEMPAMDRRHFWLVTASGVQKLVNEWPEIAVRHGITTTPSGTSPSPASV